MATFPSGTYIGQYKGVKYYSNDGTIECLFGWMPKTFSSIRAFKCAVTRREKDET